MPSLVQRWIDTRKGFKPRDVEEAVDYHWHRPLAGLLVQHLQHTRITPNQVTLLSGFFSVLAGLAWLAAAWIQPGWAVAAGFLLLGSILLDCADGQLARIRGISSMVGRILDGVMDSVAPTCVLLGMAAFLRQQGFAHGWIWPLGILTAASLSWHASQYDVCKNIYLHCSRPDFSLGGTTLLTPENMLSFKHEFEARGEWLSSFLMSVWAYWTKPQLKALIPWLDPQRCPQNDRERQAYVRIFRPAMRAFSWLGFGTHLFLLTLASWIATWQPWAIWIAWLIILAPMNLLCLWLVRSRSRSEQTFADTLAQLRDRETK